MLLKITHNRLNPPTIFFQGQQHETCRAITQFLSPPIANATRHLPEDLIGSLMLVAYLATNAIQQRELLRSITCLRSAFITVEVLCELNCLIVLAKFQESDRLS